MKFSKNLLVRSSLAFTCAMATLTSHVASAHPYASNLGDTNAVINQGFGQPVLSAYLNEAADDVTVIFDQGLPSASTNDLGAGAKGLIQFPAPGGFTTFKVIVAKVGTGSPTLISDDNNVMSQWTNGSGFAVNKNPKNGKFFGNLYASCFATSNGKTIGVTSMHPDQSQITVAGPGIPGTANTWFGRINGNFLSPSHLRVAPNNKVLVTDGQGAGNQNQIYLFEADLSSATALLGPSTSTGAGDQFGTPVAFGSLETGDLVLYVASAGTPTPSPAANPEYTNCIRGPLTSPGSFNCVFRYNIGSGPLPWNKRPDYAYTVGLDGIAQLRPDVDVAPDGTIYAGFGRANLSNPNLQILRPAITTNSPIALALTNNTDRINAISQDPTNWLYTSGITPPNNTAVTGTDPWNGMNGGGILGMYGGLRRSEDGIFFAAMDDDNGLTLATLTNGIPDDGSIFGIANASSSGLQAGMDWDIADNIWAMSRASTVNGAAQARLRCYSLGLTTTCITSNDWTGTNGSFQLTLPGALASVTVTTNTASQNYCNNLANSGSHLAKAASFNIHLNSSTLAAPVTVSFVRTGGTLHGTVNGSVDQPFNLAGNYDMLGNTNAIAAGYYTNADGISIGTNSVVFPAGSYPHAGNWQVEVPIYAATNPISGPVFTVAIRLLSGTTYSASAPVNGAIAVLNTGPQLIQLSAAVPASAQNMNRGIPGDQARFTLTRLGDTNGPGNDAVNPISHNSFTITNINYFGTAANPLDYTAAAQRFDGNLLSDSGSTSILIKPGEVTVTGAIGNPVKHTNPNIRATNLTVIINLTNHYTCPAGFSNNCTSGQCCTNVASLATNSLVSSEGYGYIVNTTTLTCNEFDNAVGGEVVLWSNPLIEPTDSTNWTAVFANVNLDPSGKLPTVISNYDNSRSTVGSEGFIAAFGKAVNDPSGDGGVSVPQSDTMTANGWTKALKVAVNKNPANQGEAGINLYPTSGTNAGKYFEGNYALRFDMFLSLYNAGLGASVTANREFAAFGINHRGTNANWRLDSNPKAGGSGDFPLNADGEWACVDAGINSITPADWDIFISTAFADVIRDENGVNTNQQAIPYADDYDKVTSVLMTNLGTGYLTARPSVGFSGGGGTGAAGTAVTNSLGQVTGVTMTSFGSGYTSIPALSLTGGSGSGAGGIAIMGSHFIIAPFSNAVQTCIGGCFTGVTNVFGNGGVPNDQYSFNNNAAGGSAPNGIIKSPPFGGITNNPNGKSVGGAPVNKWVEMSFELSRQTNLILYAARQALVNISITNPTFGTINMLAPVGGVPMLGYLDPNADLSGNNAFVYYSNIRLVELSPFIPWTNQTVNLLVTQSQSFTLSAACILGSNPITNTWFRCTTNGPGASGGSTTNAVRYARDNGTIPTNTWVLSNSVAATSMSATFTTNLNTGTNFVSVFSDAAGSVTSFVSVVEVMQGPGDKTVATGVTTNLNVTPTGNNPPTGFQWKRYGTNIGTLAGKFQVVNQTNALNPFVLTNSVLWITNVTLADATVYTCTVTCNYDPGFADANTALTVSPSGTLTAIVPPSGAVVSPAATNRPWGSPVTFTVTSAGDTPLTYQWKKGGNNIGGATDSSYTIAAVTGNDAGAGNSYTAGVTNSIGGTVSSAGVLSVAILPYTIGNQNISVSGGSVSMSFTTANSFDTAAAFSLLGCGVVTGTYTNVPGALITGPTGGPFSVTAPQTGDTMFYRLQHAP